jgi:hypothetical protein
MEELMKKLDYEYNNLKNKQSVVMDALIETMESLKGMRKNYKEDLETYNFDYKSFLDDTVKRREKVYELTRMNE